MLPDFPLKRMKGKKFQVKEYRQAFAEAELRNNLALQIKSNRVERGLSQKDLATLVGTKQSVISRCEDPSYGRLSLATLLSVANALDVCLQVKFIPYSLMLAEAKWWSTESSVVRSFSEEITFYDRSSSDNAVSVTQNLPRTEDSLVSSTGSRYKELIEDGLTYV